MEATSRWVEQCVQRVTMGSRFDSQVGLKFDSLSSSMLIPTILTSFFYLSQSCALCYSSQRERRQWKCFRYFETDWFPKLQTWKWKVYTSNMTQWRQDIIINVYIFFKETIKLPLAQFKNVQVWNYFIIYTTVIGVANIWNKGFPIAKELTLK